MKTPTERYHIAAYAMQAGVAVEMGLDDELVDQNSATSPKHLRVGINCALTDQGSLAKLLISKGIITEDEYLEALAAGMEAEQTRYEEVVSKRLGKKVTLV